MDLCVVSPPGIPRLGQMLDSFGRDELRLRVTNVFRQPNQPAQVTFEPVDTGGRVLRDRFGRKRRHTFQVSTPLIRLVPSRVVSLARAEGGVQLRVLPGDFTANG